MYVRWFKDLTIKDIPIVGGKNASLGEMYSKLTKKGVAIPNGFALTAEAYWAFIKGNKLDKKIKAILKGLDVKNVRKLTAAGKKVRNLILTSKFPEDLAKEVKAAYAMLSKGRKGKTDVAVRSSATAEDLPDASFAGQQETYLNVRGDAELLKACQMCVSSLFTDRAISYREAKGFDHLSIALSVGVQEMVRSDIGASGVMFTLDTESGFRGVVLINAAYGLGEYVVKGEVVPDQFFVYKDGVKNGFKSIIQHKLGSKEAKLVYGKVGTMRVNVPLSERKKFCLTDKEVLQIAKWGMQIEEHYGRPMDIEWAKDGGTKKLFIVQARAETVTSRASITVLETFKLAKRGKVLVEGVSVGQKIGQGKVNIIEDPKQMKNFKPGEVLVTRITDPDWEPIMRVASAIVTEQGGKTSHAAIVSRELGIPCIVGAPNARKLLKQGQEVTISCAEGQVGYIYDGRLPFEVERTEITEVTPTKTKVMLNVGDPGQAFYLAHLPHAGVGLAREEFIFTDYIKIHPLALLNYNKLKDKAVKKKIAELTEGYADKRQYLIDRLATGVAFLAAAFAPHEVILRFSDFKTNEYATLLGGKDYEPKEENPMIGWRGASRYYDKNYKGGFRMECEAVKKVREEWGLTNLILMIPFCRTIEEGQKVLATMKEFGLERGKNGLQVYVMCEIPANVILAKEFCQIFDGFSIGSNDLTQLTLGVDRDSAIVSHVYSEDNAAVKKLIMEVIKVAHENGRKVGFCGQAPSERPEYAEFLVQAGIDSISLTSDTLVRTRQRIVDMEKKLGIKAGKAVAVSSGKALEVQPPRALQKMGSKALTALGLVGLLFMVLGSTCEWQAQSGADKIKEQVTTAVMQAKLELKQEFKKEKEEAKATYSENSFAKFTLKYPIGWSVSHVDKGVRFMATDGRWFEASQISRPKTLPIKYTTSTWQGFIGVSYNDKVLDVYPGGINNSRQVIRLSGSSEVFDGFLNSFENFEFKPL